MKTASVEGQRAQVVELTGYNNFHGTHTTVTTMDVYSTETGLVAVLGHEEFARAQRELCGCDDCVCTGPHALTDEHGRVYSINVIWD